jgi:hypothetical protein
MARSSTTMKKGQTLNPNGRPPKGYSITETVRAMLDEKPEIKQALAQKVLQKALQGDKDAIRMLWNYMDGMPSQKIEYHKDEPPSINLDTK